MERTGPEGPTPVCQDDPVTSGLGPSAATPESGWEAQVSPLAEQGCLDLGKSLGLLSYQEPPNSGWLARGRAV